MEAVIEIKCADHRYLIKKDLIQAKSDFFKGLFNSGMQEAQDNYVDLPAFDQNAMLIVISYIEGGILNFRMDLIEDIMEVLLCVVCMGFEPTCACAW